MNKVSRRAVLVIVMMLVLSLTIGSAGASVRLPASESVHRQDAQTPAALCEAAMEDIPQPEKREFEQAGDVLQDGVDYGAVFCTTQGPVYIDLFEQESPITVNNFVFLAQQGFYNNTTFHRVLPGFMAQGGDPTATGAGGPGYEFEDETSNGLVFDQPGLLAMANAGPGTNGSQFFITYVATSWLDGNHTIFGRVLEGIAAAELITPRNPEYGPAYDGDSLYTVIITEDPASVAYTADAAPGPDHLQAMLEKVIVSQLTGGFELNSDLSHTYDLETAAAAWESSGGAALADYMRDALAAHAFAGSASVQMTTLECTEAPADGPVWQIGFQVEDYGTPDAAEAVVYDDERSDKLIETGAYESYEDKPDFGGRVYRRAGEALCSENGIDYRFEVPYGRYVLVTQSIVDNTVLSSDTDPTADQLLFYLEDQMLLASLIGALDRGTAATAE